ncbi:hypothetical protein RCH10_004905 [Variovorax sp. GrIS 2.14]
MVLQPRGDCAYVVRMGTVMLESQVSTDPLTA